MADDFDVEAMLEAPYRKEGKPCSGLRDVDGHPGLVKTTAVTKRILADWI